MNLFNANLRPGVTSRVEVTDCPAPGTLNRDAALVVQSSGPAAMEIFSTFANAAEHCSGAVLECLRLLFAGGAGRVHLARGQDAAAALALLEDPAIGAVVCQCQTAADYAALRTHLNQSGANMAERLGFAGASGVADALGAAKALCCERAVLCCPAAATGEQETPHPLYAPCALAARLLSSPPNHSYSGEEFPQLQGVGTLPEAEVQQLLAAGVCVFEELGGGVELVRGLTTATTQNGAGSNRLRGLNTTLISDHVVRHIRQTLKTRLKGASTASLGSIRDQVAVELAALRQEGVIAEFDPPRVRPDSGDPTACLVEIAFAVAHLIDRIYLTAHIRV